MIINCADGHVMFKDVICMITAQRREVGTEDKDFAYN